MIWALRFLRPASPAGVAPISHPEQGEDESQQGRKQVESHSDPRRDEGDGQREEIDRCENPTLPIDLPELLAGDFACHQVWLTSHIEHDETEHERGQKNVESVEQNADTDALSPKMHRPSGARKTGVRPRTRADDIHAIGGHVPALHHLGQRGVAEPDAADEREANEVG